jgi:hypothetical protein
MGNRTSTLPSSDGGAGEQALSSSTTNATTLRLERKIEGILHDMKSHPSSVSKQRKGCARLRKYCNASEAARSIVLQWEGGLDCLATVLQQHTRHATLQSHATRILCLLVKTDPSKTFAAAASGNTTSIVTALFATMRYHKRNTAIQVNGITAISLWASHSDAQLAIALVEEYSVYLLLWGSTIMMNSLFVRNATVQDKALKALVLLTSHAENRTAFLAAAGWNVLHQSCHNFNKSHHSKLLLKVFKICKHVAQDHPMAVAKRLSTTVLWVMQQLHHRHDAILQRQGCNVLLTVLTSTEKNGNPQQQQQCYDLLVAAGVRQVVVTAMEQHPEQEDIQKTAILTLQKLSSMAATSDSDSPNSNSNSTTVPPNSNSVSNTNKHADTGDAVSMGLEAMMKTLQKDSTTATTMANICKALVKLATASHTNKLDIVTAGGMPAVIQAMQKYPSTALSLQRYACQLLTQLASVEQHKRSLAHNCPGGIEAIVAAIHCQHRTTRATASLTEPSQQQQLALMKNCSSDTADTNATLESNGAAVAAAGDDKKSIAALPQTNLSPDKRTTPSSTDASYLVALHAVLALLRIAQQVDNHEKLFQAQASAALILAMQDHITQPTLQHKAMVVLNKLASRADQIIVRHHDVHKYTAHVKHTMVVQDQGAMAIVQAMHYHRDHVHIQRVGCNALGNLHHAGITSHYLVYEVGAVECILQALHHHVLQVGIQLAALKALKEYVMTSPFSTIHHYPKHNHQSRIQQQAIGIVSAIVTAMSTHTDHVGLQQVALQLLVQFSQPRTTLLVQWQQHRLVVPLLVRSNTPLQKAIVQANGLEAVMTIMRSHHPAHGLIQQTGFVVLQQMCQFNILNATRVFQRGGWGVIQGTQRACPEHATIQRQAPMVLFQLVLLFLLHYFLYCQVVVQAGDSLGVGMFLDNPLLP